MPELDLVSKGMTTCQGCAMELIARSALEVLGPKTITMTPPSCSAIITGNGDETGWGIPCVQTVLMSLPAFASGVSEALKIQGKNDVNVMGYAGDGGTFDITANDDGLNAADGTSNAPGMANENCWIEINDGEFTIVSDGDSIDSNGDLTINGGTLDLTCNGNGNTAIDTDGTYTNNGGDVTTNDGSENGSGEMGSFGGQGNAAAGGPGGQMGQPGGGGQMPDSAPGQNDQNGTAST